MIITNLEPDRRVLSGSKGRFDFRDHLQPGDQIRVNVHAPSHSCEPANEIVLRVEARKIHTFMRNVGPRTIYPVSCDVITIYTKERLQVLKSRRKTEVGYEVYAVVDRRGGVRYLGGCRNFSYEEARLHYSKKTLEEIMSEMSFDDLIYAKKRQRNARDCMAIVRELSKRALALIKKSKKARDRA